MRICKLYLNTDLSYIDHISALHKCKRIERHFSLSQHPHAASLLHSSLSLATLATPFPCAAFGVERTPLGWLPVAMVMDHEKKRASHPSWENAPDAVSFHPPHPPPTPSAACVQKCSCVAICNCLSASVSNVVQTAGALHWWIRVTKSNKGRVKQMYGLRKLNILILWAV